MLTWLRSQPVDFWLLRRSVRDTVTACCSSLFTCSFSSLPVQMSATNRLARMAGSRLVSLPAVHSTIRCAPWSPSLTHTALLLVPPHPSVSLATGSNPTSTLSHRPDALSPSRLLSRRSAAALSQIESRGSVLDLYRKICRLLPQVLKAYELQGEDSYHRALRNIRFYFENHKQLQDSNVIEVLRHKAEMEIEEAMLMSAIKQGSRNTSSTRHSTHWTRRLRLLLLLAAVWSHTSHAACCAMCCVVLCLPCLLCQVQDQVSRRCALLWRAPTRLCSAPRQAAEGAAGSGGRSGCRQSAAAIHIHAGLPRWNCLVGTMRYMSGPSTRTEHSTSPRSLDIR